MNHKEEYSEGQQNWQVQEISRTSLRDFLQVVFKRKAQIVLFFVVTVCTVAIGTFVTKPTYEAKAHILVKVGRESMYVPATGSSSPVISINREEQISPKLKLEVSEAK